MSLLKLERFAYSPDGTFGRFFMPSGKVFFTVERPWLDNEESLSCIPEGIYALHRRPSQIVTNSTHGEYTDAYEVMGVPGRSDILIHPANWPSELRGCIGPGTTYVVLTGRNAVSNSVLAFKQIMEELDVTEGSWQLEVTHFDAGKQSWIGAM